MDLRQRSDERQPSAEVGGKDTRQPMSLLKRSILAMGAIALLAIVIFALSRLGIHRIVAALTSAQPGWVALAFALMMLSLLLRSVSWHQTLNAALPGTAIGWLPVARATMIGVMGSALFPGRVGELSRVLVITRRLGGPKRTVLPVVAGTVFSQTLINLLALAVLAVVAFSSVSLLHGHESSLEAAVVVPLVICLLVLSAPSLLRLGRHSASQRIRDTADTVARLFSDARLGLIVFARPRRGFAAVSAQLFAWVLQWLACYAILLALGLQSLTGPVAAAAILLAVNVSAVVPATPSNVGVFQAACLVVLAAYGVGAGPGLAYGIILQAVEVLTAVVLGVPALLGEGMSWSEMRRVDPTDRQPVS
jgi:phosphatidyl-myo-inositol alpha-mannosyltransferase